MFAQVVKLGRTLVGNCKSKTSAARLITMMKAALLSLVQGENTTYCPEKCPTHRHLINPEIHCHLTLLGKKLLLITVITPEGRLALVTVQTNKLLEHLGGYEIEAWFCLILNGLGPGGLVQCQDMTWAKMNSAESERMIETG